MSMFASELIKAVQEIIDEYGDMPVETFDLDRDCCAITEVEHYTSPHEYIYIG